MTKSQILVELEALKDYMNDAGKAMLTRVSASVALLEELPLPPVAPTEKRTVVRDETSDQKLGLAK